MKVSRRVLLGSAALGAGLPAAAAAIVARAGATFGALQLTHPDGRKTSYRFAAPGRGGVWGVVLFSHGANSSNADYDRLWQPWAARGYLVIGPNHIDTGPPASQPKIGRSELWRARVADTSLPLDQRAPFEAVAKGVGARIDWRGVCAAGHSFGAVVAQALAGARLLDPGDQEPFHGAVQEVCACMTFSPPGPLAGFIPADAWAGVTAPSLLQTGDADVLPGFVDDWRLRLTGFAGAPDRWTIVGRGVNHYFGGLICRRTPEAGALTPALDETAALSGGFLDAYVRRSAGSLKALRERAGRGDDGVLTFAAA
jgi:dienelactone hydrolase